MSKHIRVENGVVVECLDYVPQNASGDWRVAIEVVPTLIPGRQILGSHHFDLEKNPAEIVWSHIDLQVNERKNQMLADLNQSYYKIIESELIKEFEGIDADFALVQNAIATYRQKKSAISSLVTHDDIDNYIAASE